MGRKARQKGEREIRSSSTSTKTAPGETSREDDAPIEPIAGGVLDGALFAVAAITVVLVGVYFSLDVNRVFDVPKALALKVGGSGAFLAWLVLGIFGKGYPWRSIRLFFAPVVALLGAVAVSTLTSIDLWMSLYGVYERQFGLQGLLSCVGLFVVCATCLRSRRGALAGLAVLVVVGGTIGSYSWLQSVGMDPFGFFRAPHNKVYAMLGNATFAGNALALIFPISAMLAIVASAAALGRDQSGDDYEEDAAFGARLAVYAVGLVAIAALQILPSVFTVPDAGMTASGRQGAFKLGVGVSWILLLFLGVLGSQGPEWGRLESKAGRRFADSAAAGALAALVIGIAVGLLKTRTRGAWVGTAVAITGGLILLPKLFHDAIELQKKVRVACWGLLGASVVGLVVLITAAPESLYAKTILSIPHAFNPEKTVYGQGQGTRRYLWTESPRVLADHHLTLERQANDRKEFVALAPDDVDKKIFDPFPRELRRILVWPFGIGIETYRYAFMSHKSKQLEALDPMTNHDNPHNNYLYLLASCGIVGLAAYLWLLWRLISVAWRRFEGRDVGEIEVGSPGGPVSRSDRALAFGVVTSFFSYAVYSIAGFDSVACSVFFYFLLGCAAVLFAPSGDEARRPILVQIRRQWAAWRKRPDAATIDRAPVWATIAALAIPGGLMLHTIVAIGTVNAAEKAFVADARTFDEKIGAIEKAIALNPRESFYWQSLGSTLGDFSRQYREAAMRAQQQGKVEEAKAYLDRAEQLFRRAERSFHGGLSHAWAPENAFISLFQLYYGWGKSREAAQALERALEHSPHLGPVRANLAVLKAQELNDLDGALRDCLWVLEIDPANATSLRTCGRVYQLKGNLKEAERYLGEAQKIAPSDPTLKAFVRDLERAKASTAPPP